MNTSSGPQDIVAGTSGSPVWNPLTDAMDSTGFREVRLDVRLLANPFVEVKPGVQFSADGITWASPVLLTTTWNSTTGWSYGTPKDLYTEATSSRYPFVRFGVQAQNTGAGTNVNRAQVEVRVQGTPLPHHTAVATLAVVHTQGSTSTGVFFPVLSPVASSTVGEYRVTLEVVQQTSDTTVKVGYQTSDDPSDEGSWSAPTLTAVARSSVGVTAADGFTSVSPAGRFLRFGLGAFNTSGSGIDLATCNLRVDTRVSA